MSDTTSLLKLKNISLAEQSVVMDGIKYSILPGQTASFPENVAGALLMKCHPHVTMSTTIASYVDNTAQPPMWLMNATGNFNEPEEMYASFKGIRSSAFHNYNKEPRHLYLRMNGGQDLKGRNLAPRSFEIPPFHRVQFPRDVAGVWLSRDGVSAPGCRNAIKEARAPTAFEPNETWSLKDLIVYARLIDGALPIPAIDSEQDKVDARMWLFNQLFLRFADPAYVLPTKEEFDAFKERGVKKVTKRASGPKQVAKSHASP